MQRKREIKRRLLKRDAIKQPFSACAFSLIDDLNIHLIYRTLSNFGGKEFFIVGSKKWFKGATKGLEELVSVKHFKNEFDFFEFMEEEKNYTFISVEQTKNSKNIVSVKKYPKNPCFIFGNESFGLNNNVLTKSNFTIEIPHKGFHPCLNVGTCSGIVFYDFFLKNIKELKNERTKTYLSTKSETIVSF